MNRVNPMLKNSICVYSLVIFSLLFLSFVKYYSLDHFTSPLQYQQLQPGEKDLCCAVVESCFKSNETLVVRTFYVNSSSSLLTFLIKLKVPGSRECLCSFHINSKSKYDGEINASKSLGWMNIIRF